MINTSVFRVFQSFPAVMMRYPKGYTINVSDVCCFPNLHIHHLILVLSIPNSEEVLR